MHSLVIFEYRVYPISFKKSSINNSLFYMNHPNNNTKGKTFIFFWPFLGICRRKAWVHLLVLGFNFLRLHLKFSFISLLDRKMKFCLSQFVLISSSTKSSHKCIKNVFQQSSQYTNNTIHMLSTEAQTQTQFVSPETEDEIMSLAIDSPVVTRQTTILNTDA